MSVASKNFFDLLRTEDGDSDTAPQGPVNTSEKTNAQSTKRSIAIAASKEAYLSSDRRGGSRGNEAAHRDRNARSDQTRDKTVDDSARGSHRGGRESRGRGGRGARFHSDRDDRHSKRIPHGGNEKQAAQSWGANDGEAEWKDEKAGEEIATIEQKEVEEDEPTGAEAEAEAEPESAEPPKPGDKHISYADYLAQQAEKQLALESENHLNMRKPNEGSKEQKTWASAKALVKEDDDNFMAGSGGKPKRERERKAKQLMELDNRYMDPERPRSGRGGRAGRNGNRGGGRNDRGDYRGSHRGSRETDSQALHTEDKSVFPSLGKS